MGGKKLGLIYSYNEQWIGGTYYIENLVNALDTTADNEQPEIIVWSDKPEDFQRLKKVTGYKKLDYKNFDHKLPFHQRLINKVFRTIGQKDVFDKRPDPENYSCVFPNPPYYYFDRIPKIYWIADFQEDHLPGFFSAEEIKNRKAWQKSLAANDQDIVLSSHSAEKDFRRLYPASRSRIFILPFAVTHPSYSHLNIEGVRLKYNLPGRYFFSPNQFWAHKNHMVVLKAIKKLKEANIEVCVAFSGKENDYRNPDYFTTLKQFVLENNLSQQVRFLGFIDRSEQLILMKNAMAVIQPSLFEGWSTVVEDSKAMDQFVIASSLDVHKEQLDRNSTFFEPSDETALSEILIKHISDPPQKVSFNYQAQVKQFAKKFMEIVKTVGSE